MYHLTLKSRNEKTGPIPVSTSSRDTCPESCPFKKREESLDEQLRAACYAEYGPLKWHWDAVSSGRRGYGLESFLLRLYALPELQLWRHLQAGDQTPDKTDKTLICGYTLRQIVEANRGKRGWTYTHYSMRDTWNRWLVHYANRNGFIVNVSANNPHHADELAQYGVAPVVVTVPATHPVKSKTPQGRTMLVCPAQVRDDMNCAKCQLCAKPMESRKGVIVAFRAHGAGADQITL